MSQNNAINMPQNDLMDSSLLPPENKLDADQYSADDIDGVTESVFGSGNMAYASLQASQANATIELNEALSSDSNYVFDGDDVSFAYKGDYFGPDAAVFHPLGHPSSHAQSDTDRVLDSGDKSGIENYNIEEKFSHSAAGTLGATTIASGTRTVSSISSADLDGSNVESSSSNTTVNNVTNNIINVDDTVQNVVNSINETIQNITNLGDEIIGNIIEGDVGEVIHVVNNQISDLTETINTEINNLNENVNQLLQDFGVTETAYQVTEVTNEVTQTVSNTLNEAVDSVFGDGGIALDLDSGLLNSLGTGLHVSAEDSITGNIGTGLVSGNLAGTVNDLTGLDAPIWSGTGANVGFDLLNTGAPDGNDVSIAGIDTPDIALDPIESIIGDIDIDVELPGEVANPETLPESVQDTLNSLDDIALADPDSIPGILGGQGADGGFGLSMGETTLGDEFDVHGDSLLEGAGGLPDTGVNSLSEHSGILSDFSTDGPPGGDDVLPDVEDALDISDAIDLLVGTIENVTGDIAGGLGDTGWTESAIDAGGIFDDIVNGIGGEADDLPDPVGTVAEGIGALDVVPDLDLGSLGGLFG